MMPRLQHLKISLSDSELLDRWLFPLCPNLKSLYVHLDDFMDPNAPPSRWPTLHFPDLTRLELCGQAAFMFDPASFNDMPLLEELHVWTLSDGRSWLDHWTWDWNLPGLTRLELRTRASDVNFSFRILRGCPKLKSLIVSCGRVEDGQSLIVPCRRVKGGQSYLPNVVSELTRPLQEIFPSLEELCLAGCVSLRPEDLRALVGYALPGLRVLNMYRVNPCTVEQVVEFTRHHPSLKDVTLWHEPPNKDLKKQLGLDTECRD
ncbi:hypothetical protein DFQ27_003241, partial [Actinomortierella ambigua]